VPAALPVDVVVAGDAATGNVLDPKLSCVAQPVNPARSVWFRFVAPVNGTVRVDTSGSDYDTALGVFTGVCNALVEIGCDDDAGLGALTSRVDVEASAGSTYTVLVTPYLNNSPGRLHVHVAYEDVP